MAGNVIEYFSPTRAGLISRQTINVFSAEMLGYELVAMGGAAIADVTPGANATIHHPLILSSSFVVNQIFWVNGTTVAGNTDIGIYNEDGSALLVSTGATANSGSGTIQIVNVTDYRLSPNRRLWLTLGTDSATHQYTRITLSAPAADYVGIKTMAAGLSSSALVVPATFAVGSNSGLWCGITGASVI